MSKEPERVAPAPEPTLAQPKPRTFTREEKRAQVERDRKELHRKMQKAWPEFIKDRWSHGS